MNQLREIKNEFISHKLYKKYKKKFRHKQFRFLITKLFLIRSEEFYHKTVLELELMLFKSKKSENMFVPIFKKFKQEAQSKCDWESFAKFLWYQYQTSTYKYDKRHGISNIYNKNNYIELNQIRRQYYYKWLNSLPLNTPNFNKKIIQIMELVF